VDVSQNYSLLRMIREGREIDVNKGTFGSGGMAAYWEKWVSRTLLTTSATTYQLFNTPVNQGGLTAADTNTVATQVPGGERWDLMGLGFYFQTVTGAPMDLALKSALNVWLQSARYIITFNNQVVRRVPLWAELGSQLAQETTVSTVTSMQSPLPRATGWYEAWPEEMYLPLSSNIVMDFRIECAATNSALNGMYFGAAFDRVKASKTP
jgi:hypothetical protein